MKKLLTVITMFISLITFSGTLKDGTYEVVSKKNNEVAEMRMIVKNSKILSIKFDQKKDNKSYSLDSKDFREKNIRITREISAVGSIEGVKLDFNENSNEVFKKLYYFLIEKSENGQTGSFEYK